jgi:elongation factor Ts
MHIAAAKPEFLSENDVPAARLAKERDIFVEQTKNSGKPQHIIDKMVEGRVRKFYEETCLLNQFFIMDNSVKISDLLRNFGKAQGGSVEIQEYALFVLGEGLEKKADDFASEVNSMLK